MKFKVWLWWFEFKIKKVQDKEKVEFLTKALWNELEKTDDLVVSTGAFKEVSIQKFPSNNMLKLVTKTNAIYSFETNKY